MGANSFDREGSQLKAPFGRKLDNLGREIILARCHTTLVAGTPYRIKYDEFGQFSAGLAADNDTYFVAIAKKAYVTDIIGEFVIAGQYSGMVTTSLSVSVGHGFGIGVGAVTDVGSDFSDLEDVSFGLCYTVSVESLTQDVIMIGHVITASSS
ncbi:hypothetical protein LCGC14_1984500 [marine sediment metagenome]|uniref:Uncharacterized protein n=1 Tax=marine sediment metagenome TaxID=412755 RepID=A0A0F9F7U7_9ZZZZ